jgi:hypothetical protein
VDQPALCSTRGMAGHGDVGALRHVFAKAGIPVLMSH